MIIKKILLICFLIVNALSLNLRQNVNETEENENLNEMAEPINTSSEDVLNNDIDEMKDEKINLSNNTIEEKNESIIEEENVNISNETKEDEHNDSNITSIDSFLLNRMSNDLSLDNEAVSPINNNTIDKENPQSIIVNETIEPITPMNEIKEEPLDLISPLPTNESEIVDTVSVSSTPSNKQSNNIITIEQPTPIINNAVQDTPVIDISPASNIETIQSSIPNDEILTVNTPADTSIPLINIESSPSIPIVSSESSKIESPTTIIEEPIFQDTNQISGANSLSVSNSEANNYKVLSSTLSDYEGLNQFVNQYIPTTNTVVEQVLTQDQINALAQLNNELNINSYSLPQQYFNDILDLQASIRPIYPIIQGQCISMNWFGTNFKANDIGVSSHGDVYAAGIDGHLYSYDMTRNKWRKVKGNFDLGSITRVAVAPDGTPYVITAAGSTYYLTPANIWVRLPGCASDIAIGRGGEVYKIGCDIRPNGYGIYRLFNNEENELEYKKHSRCLRNKGLCAECAKANEENMNDMNKVYWFRLSGSGVRISVSPSGQPYIVNNGGMILSYEDSNWVPILTGGLARDITLTNDGEIFYVDLYHNIFRIVNRNGNVYQLCGMGTTISAGPFSQPFIVGVDHSVYTASKYIMS